MTYPGENQPDIEKAILNGNTLASGQVVVFSEGVAISGDATATLGGAIAVIDPTNGVPKVWLYKNGAIGVGADDRTGIREEFGAQVALYWGASRIFYANNNGLNLGERRIDGARFDVVQPTVNFNVNSQSTGATYDNVNASAAITGSLPGPSVSEGHHYWFYNNTGDRLAITPNGADKIITPTGALSDGQSIVLTSIGASVHLMANSQGDWMTLSQLGTVEAV